MAASEDDAADGAHIAVVAAPADGEALRAGEEIVCGIEIDPIDSMAVKRNPRMGGVGADEFFTTGRRNGFDVAADIARGEANGTQAGQSGDGQNPGKRLACFSGRFHREWRQWSPPDQR